MFLGSYVTSFDLNSRRIALPKKIRDYLATSEIILSFGFEKCIFGFDVHSWNKEAQKQIDEPLTQKQPRTLRRFFFSSAIVIRLDDQGRFVIPANYLEYAHIKKPIVIGAGDHFEIWEEKLWAREKTRVEQIQK